MTPKPPPVKTERSKTRRYDASGRQERARRSRERIMDAALARFLADGFAATQVASIAADAEVSVDTIYKSFGGKPGLVQALCERGLMGEGPVPAERRSDALQATEEDPRLLMAALGRFVTEVAPRTAPLMLLLKVAGDTDPEMARLRAEQDANRLERMTDNARRMAGRGIIRDDLSVEEAGEISWVYTSPELYELLVVQRGWSDERFGEFVGNALAAALLPTSEAP